LTEVIYVAHVSAIDAAPINSTGGATPPNTTPVDVTSYP